MCTYYYFPFCKSFQRKSADLTLSYLYFFPVHVLRAEAFSSNFTRRSSNVISGRATSRKTPNQKKQKKENKKAPKPNQTNKRMKTKKFWCQMRPWPTSHRPRHACPSPVGRNGPVSPDLWCSGQRRSIQASHRVEPLYVSGPHSNYPPRPLPRKSISHSSQASNLAQSTFFQ